MNERMEDQDSADMWAELEWRQAVQDDYPDPPHPLANLWLWAGIGCIYAGVVWLIVEHVR